MEEKEIEKYNVQLSRVVFENGDFKIVNFINLKDCKPMVVKGIYPDLVHGMKYSIMVEPVIDPKYGKQFNLVNIRSSYDLTDKTEAKKFLSYFLTPFQIRALFSYEGDPIQLLKDKDINTLTEIKGISTFKANKLITAYEENKDNSKLYTKLYDYGISLKGAAKLLNVYKSPDLIIQKLTENPYILIDEVEGYGWKKTDAIALNMGVAPTSRFRLEAFVKYYLETCANEKGNTWVDLQELRNAFYEEIPEASDEQVRETLKILSSSFGGTPVIQYYPETNRICLTKYRNLEKEIAQELKRLISAPNLVYDKTAVGKVREELEKINGWEFAEEQMLATEVALDNPVSIITGSAGCVDCDTEFFNGKEWKKISNWEPEDKVLQYNKDGTANLVAPQRYVKNKKEKLWHFSTKYGLDQCLSDNHQVYYITSKGNLYHKTFGEIKQAHEKSVTGFEGRFITSFSYEDGKGINLSNAEIKLMCAVICDGSFSAEAKPNQHSYYTCRFHIKKDRKKKKLIEIFDECKLPYREVKSATMGYTDFYVQAPLREKTFTPKWYNCTKEQLQTICNNILFWDGSTLRDRKSFSTTIKETADFIQFAFTSCNYRATVKERDRKGQTYFTYGKSYLRKSIEYTVLITNRNLISMGGTKKGKKTPIVEYLTKDGYEYCFTVPSHMWVMRRNGKICVSGNCGKSSSIQLATTVLNKGHSYSIAQTALSGRAASRMAEITGLQGFTIHRLIGLKSPTASPKFNKEKPLAYDIIILDETSMVDGQIFLSLLRSIRTGAKLIMLGDIHQLEAIGLCNLLNDMIASGQIPYVKLEKIHRQAAKSGILSTASLVKDGKQIIPSIDYEGEMILGELKDLNLISLQGNKYTQEVILDNYKKLLKKGIPKDDIDVIVPMRKKGEICLNTLNQKIQDIVANPNFNSITVQHEDNNITIYENDKIIVTQNCYVGAFDKDENPIPIFNGNIGKLVKIEDDHVVLAIFTVGTVKLDKKYSSVLDLGYAITCHAKQGSEIPYAIVALDSTCYTLASREWLYTALTRAKKYCILIGQNTTLFKAVRTSSILKKQTWLAEILKG